MQIQNDRLILSASDLANHLSCHHLTELDAFAAKGKLTPPDYRDPALEVLMERGLRHEDAYLNSLEADGLTVHRLDPELAGEAATNGAIDAMRAGHNVIAQAALASGRWRGRTDILLRVDTPSRLGNYSYEVVDTKLARETKAGTILQLCLYSDLLAQIQGTYPEHFHVQTPIGAEKYRCSDFAAYFRLVRGHCEQQVDSLGDEVALYPEPASNCDICRWWQQCDHRRRQDDHLSFVADIRVTQRAELAEQGVTTLQQLAGQTVPLTWRPERGSVASFERAANQARLQLEERETKNPSYELLETEPDAGLGLLPEPDAGDVFFDIEGDAFVGISGLEYLFGYVTLENGEPVYHEEWALNATEEKAMFEGFIRFLTERAEAYPNFHIYHFGAYEPSALKRLMCRYGICEDELDMLLRSVRFVDLHRVVRQSLIASVENYSIKELEKFFGFTREMDLRDASKALRKVEWPLELAEPESIPTEAREDVVAYNRDDCVSTLRLRDWLEELREGAIADGAIFDRPIPKPPEAGDALTERIARVRQLQAQLLDGVPEDPEEHSDAQKGLWTLAHLLEYFRREQKVIWWEYFRLKDLQPDELLDEKNGLYGLQFVQDLPLEGNARVPVHRYRFQAQDCEMKIGCEIHAVEEKIGTLVALDKDECTIDIKKTGKTIDAHPVAVFGHEAAVPSKPIEAALVALAEWVVEHGIEADSDEYRAERDLLLRRRPRFAPADPDPLQQTAESTLAAACRLAGMLDSSTLAIQGPPGSGKTYTGSHMICDLVRQGKRVGVTAISHKVIFNLLKGVAETAEKQKLDISIVRKGKQNGDDAEYGIAVLDGNPLTRRMEAGEFDVLGATAWLWAKPDLQDTFDVLFIDEAGQMSMAMILAAASAAKNLVFLGDPIQLEQPQQGTHPDGVAVSGLEYLLGEHKTMPRDCGLFLADTYRLHPSICEFTSEVFYESRLSSVAGLDRQILSDCSPFDGAGLWHVPVAHQGNQNASAEEAEAIAAIFHHLLDGLWTDCEGKSRQLTSQDILIVAPFNAQVNLILETLPQARVGTVDKFQGQEAPVVIYSMASSTPEDAPRGMTFLYDLSRLNVATSRARCGCILVASPVLFDPECRTPAQMRLANAHCRYIEMAREVDWAAL